MEKKSLAHELVRARIAEIALLKMKLDELTEHLEKLLAAQLQIQALVEDREENSYALAAVLGDEGADQGGLTEEDDAVSPDVLLELAVRKMKD
ncbi:hypothetical protein PHYSODRAFT_486468 [Phytophthora sojae]|uniref:Uncharacterized protein n=1 Tax=Phytophthora sojae (strain P6497) TaxID=1094619 RepID=G4YUA0_PHYSP|nr:hypothetical protein PHYSODRAFT_486468 [Phytophthora sojae]EGZ24284.1 hypothetical protein PHYSODRAFT_486468 [Phytophthora sojae]|eukprot:XP_009519572.1 hypothetical protein PHYSODRAFT_486468 [Phytophthora sojae]